MKENEQDLQTVMESTGCDRWIARKALTSSDGSVHNAIDLVKKRMSYQTSTCRCGELIAEKWNYCPYCGTKKECRPFGGVFTKRPAKWISVTECLPNYGDIVLIFEDNHWNRGVEVAKFIKDEVFGNNKTPYSWVAPQGPMSWFGQYVSHWMPLPAPPSGVAAQRPADPRGVAGDGLEAGIFGPR